LLLARSARISPVAVRQDWADAGNLPVLAAFEQRELPSNSAESDAYSCRSATKELAPVISRVTIQAMETAKDHVQQILSTLPEDATLEDIQYHIYVRQKIEQGLADVDAGRVISHAEVQQRLAKWLSK
jgi:predicted transcriptional regulator